MPIVKFGESYFSSLKGESVLDTLIRNEAEVSFSCRSGICHTCVLRRVDGKVPIGCQSGLKDALCNEAYFLACQYVPEVDVQVELPDAERISEQ